MAPECCLNICWVAPWTTCVRSEAFGSILRTEQDRSMASNVPGHRQRSHNRPCDLPATRPMSYLSAWQAQQTWVVLGKPWRAVGVDWDPPVRWPISVGWWAIRAPARALRGCECLRLSCERSWTCYSPTAWQRQYTRVLLGMTLPSSRRACLLVEHDDDKYGSQKCSRYSSGASPASACEHEGWDPSASAWRTSLCVSPRAGCSWIKVNFGISDLFLPTGGVSTGLLQRRDDIQSSIQKELLAH